ncbi:MAG: RidA family protein [Kiloniellales bacterium]|nr:RidA family protein [Kiloniellales bacterium]
MRSIDWTHPHWRIPPTGYAQVVTAPADARLVFVSGQLGDRPDGRRAPTFGAQVAWSFENLEHALRAAGASRRSVLQITILVVDHDSGRLQVVSEARRQFFGEHRPASTLIPVPRLACDWMLFEINAIALAGTAD